MNKGQRISLLTVWVTELLFTDFDHSSVEFINSEVPFMCVCDSYSDCKAMGTLRVMEQFCHMERYHLVLESHYMYM